MAEYYISLRLTKKVSHIENYQEIMPSYDIMAINKVTAAVLRSAIEMITQQYMKIVQVLLKIIMQLMSLTYNNSLSKMLN